MSKVVDVVSNSNDALGTTVGSKSNGKYSAAVLSAFGESLEALQCEATSNFKHQTSNSQTFFTGKPYVEGLGHAFWMRNYRAGLAKWQTTDPMGYPDGWNQLAYCNNGVTSAVDLWGCATVTSVVCDDLRFFLRLLEIRWDLNQWWSESQVRNEADAILKSEAVNSLVRFCNAANAPTILWFQSSAEWRLVHDAHVLGYWEWVKE